MGDDQLLGDDRGHVFLSELFDFLDLMGGAKAVKEMHERNAGF